MRWLIGLVLAIWLGPAVVVLMVYFTTRVSARFRRWAKVELLGTRSD
jgi:hypothetical protein